MVNSVHFKCVKLKNGQAMYVSHVEGTTNFLSGYWDISEAEAQALIGGWLYLHETKSAPSYRGGKICGFKHEVRTDVARQHRIGLLFRPRMEAVGAMWRGAAHDMAWSSGLVEANFPHEAADA